MKGSRAVNMEELHNEIPKWLTDMNLAGPISKSNDIGRMTMKRSIGNVGEFRVFTCRHCGSTFEKFFCHFERPEKFPTSECIMCNREAVLETPAGFQVETATQGT